MCRLAASPNETHIAVGYADGNVKIFDFNSTENVCTFSGHKSAITALTFDQDGTRLASGSKVCLKAIKIVNRIFHSDAIQLFVWV